MAPMIFKYLIRKSEDTKSFIYMGNGDKAHIEGARTYLLPLPNNCTFEHFDCLYVPTMRRNLLSVVPLEKLGFSYFFLAMVSLLFIKTMKYF